MSDRQPPGNHHDPPEYAGYQQQASGPAALLRPLRRAGRVLWDNRYWRSTLLTLLMLASLAVLFITLGADWQTLAQYDWRIDWLMLALSSVVYSGSLALAVLAWAAIMRALRADATWQQDARFFLYSWMVRRLPTPAPYIASRVLLYERIGVPRRLTLMGILWETIMLIASSALLTLLLLPLTPLLRAHVPLPLVLAVGAVGLLLLARPHWLGQAVNWLLRRFKQEPIDTFLSLRIALLVLGLHSLLWLTGGLILFLLGRAIYPVRWELLLLVAQSWIISGLVAYLSFFTPLGSLLRDVTLGVLLVAAGLPASVALAMVLLTRVWVTINELAWAALLSRL